MSETSSREIILHKHKMNLNKNMMLKQISLHFWYYRCIQVV